MKVMPLELLLVGTFRTQVLNPDIRGKCMQFKPYLYTNIVPTSWSTSLASQLFCFEECLQKMIVLRL